MKILFFLFFLHLTAWAQFETPKGSKTELLQESDFVEDERLKLNCRVYSNYVVAEKVEPGFVGNSIFVKLAKSEKSQEKLNECNDVDLESYKKIPTQGMIVWGVKGNYLFLKDADELSSRTKFEIFNMESQSLVYQGVRNNDLLFKVLKTGSTNIALEYFHMYPISCDFTAEKEGHKCWREFLKSIQPNSYDSDTDKALKKSEREKLAKFVSLPLPKCPSSKNKKKYQVFLKIQVPNIDKGKRKILYSKPNCEIAP